MRSAKEVGVLLAAYCRERRFVEAVEALYAEDAVSVEALDYEGAGRETVGRVAIVEKNVRWLEANDLHGIEVTAVYASPERVALQFVFDRTRKEGGVREPFGEIGVYTVENGSIVREEFLYL